jgi:hypothetical protein
MLAGRFPRSLALLGGRAVRWREDEIRRWIESQPRRRLRHDQDGINVTDQPARAIKARWARRKAERVRVEREPVRST